MKEDLDEDTVAFIEKAEEWFQTIPQSSEQELREFLKGDQPVDAGKSFSQIRGTSYSLLIHNMDYEALRFKQRKLFAENAIFSRKQIKFLEQKYDISEFQARAVNFVNLLLLCDAHEDEAVELHKQIVEKFLEEGIQKIQVIFNDENLTKFRAATEKVKNESADGIEITTDITLLRKYTHKFIKTPNVGRNSGISLDAEQEELKIKGAIMQLLEKKAFVITNVLSVDDALKITKAEICETLAISRPTFDKRLHLLKIDFDLFVDEITNQFIKENKSKNSFIAKYRNI